MSESAASAAEEEAPAVRRRGAVSPAADRRPKSIGRNATPNRRRDGTAAAAASADADADAYLRSFGMEGESSDGDAAIASTNAARLLAEELARLQRLQTRQQEKQAELQRRQVALMERLSPRSARAVGGIIGAERPPHEGHRSALSSGGSPRRVDSPRRDPIADSFAYAHTQVHPSLAPPPAQEEVRSYLYNPYRRAPQRSSSPNDPYLRFANNNADANYGYSPTGARDSRPPTLHTPRRGGGGAANYAAHDYFNHNYSAPQSYTGMYAAPRSDELFFGSRPTTSGPSASYRPDVPSQSLSYTYAHPNPTYAEKAAAEGYQPEAVMPGQGMRRGAGGQTPTRVAPLPSSSVRTRSPIASAAAREAPMPPSSHASSHPEKVVRRTSEDASLLAARQQFLAAFR